MTTDLLPAPCCALGDPHHVPSKALSPLLSHERTVDKVNWHARVLWSPRTIPAEGLFRDRVWGAADGGCCGVGDRTLGREVGLLPQTPRMSCRLNQWRRLRGESGQDCH